VNTEDIAPGGVVHLWEHRDVLKQVERLQNDNKRLRGYAKYIANRMSSHAMILNDGVSPIVAASIIDDLDDASSIYGIEPRDWK